MVTLLSLYRLPNCSPKSCLYIGCLYTETQMYSKLGGLLIFRRGIKDSFHLSLKTGLYLQQLGDSMLILYFSLF